MRSVLAWIWNEVVSTISSVSSNYLMPIVIAIACIGILSSFYLYQSLHVERLEKEQALAQVVTLENTVVVLQQTKNADNKIAQIIINQSDILNNLNTKVALEIAGIPKLEWEHSNEHVQKHINEHLGEQKSNTNETTACNIDIPLPRLSAPLLLLYNEVSRTNTSTASVMAHGNKPLTCTASQRHDSSPVGTVDKGASHDLR